MAQRPLERNWVRAHCPPGARILGRVLTLGPASQLTRRPTHRSTNPLIHQSISPIWLPLIWLPYIRLSQNQLATISGQPASLPESQRDSLIQPRVREARATLGHRRNAAHQLCKSCRNIQPFAHQSVRPPILPSLRSHAPPRHVTPFRLAAGRKPEFPTTKEKTTPDRNNLRK